MDGGEREVSNEKTMKPFGRAMPCVRQVVRAAWLHPLGACTAYDFPHETAIKQESSD
jgi:hypothetical protein